jgi:hypothetical protein
MLRKYLVREGFHVHQNGKHFPPGSTVELTDEEAQDHIIRIEPETPGDNSEDQSKSDEQPGESEVSEPESPEDINGSGGAEVSTGKKKKGA